MTTAKKQRKIHPALFIVAFFAVLIVLETAFLVVASLQPDDRIQPPSGETARVEKSDVARD